LPQPCRGRRAAIVNRRKLQTWLAWWILLTGLWLMVDDSLRVDELLAGMASAALAALLVAAVRDPVRDPPPARLLGRQWHLVACAASLPGLVARDTGEVFAALYRRLAHGELPSSGYTEIPMALRGGASRHRAGRVLLAWEHSLAPNQFAVGIDPGRDAMLVHQLVPRGPGVSPPGRLPGEEP
jgi:multisubunit Na+/H+ antiporter MnhE subunit